MLGLSLLPTGCMTGPRFDNPMKVENGPEPAAAENPILVFPKYPNGQAYREVFDRVLDVIDDFFAIAYVSHYEGRIVGKPTVAPGYEQPWKPGSPDVYQRSLVSLQSYRYRCEVRIREAEPAGYFVQITVLKELKDIPNPYMPYYTTPVFGDGSTVDRAQLLVVNPDATSPLRLNPNERWIPKGRETGIEQAMLRKIQRCQ